MEIKRVFENFNLDVSGYADFQGREMEVIAEMIASAPTLNSLIPQTGIKAGTSTDLNILRTDVTWSTGDCVVTETGDNTNLTPRIISCVRLTDREEICLDKLDSKVPQLQSAGARNEDLTFENALVELKVKQNAKALEKLAWIGSITGGSANLAVADGYIEIAKSETADLAYYTTQSASTVATIIDDVRIALNKRTDEMYENGATLYMSNSYAAMLSQALVEANLFNFAAVSENELGQMTFMFPGTSVKVIGTYGLNTNDSLFMTINDNLRYGTDLEADRENVEVFFNKYHKVLVSDLVYAIGFQYEFPEQVIFIERL